MKTQKTFLILCNTIIFVLIIIHFYARVAHLLYYKTTSKPAFIDRSNCIIPDSSCIELYLLEN